MTLQRYALPPRYVPSLSFLVFIEEEITVRVRELAKADLVRHRKVAQWLLKQDVDVLVTADDIHAKGPGYALGDAGVEIFVTRATKLERALEILPNSSFPVINQ